jgi:molybdenum cofactor guanylyltransferase
MKTKTINGLILIGGRSSRMGSDKSLLAYHGQSQRAYLYELLNKYCSKVFFSCREEQDIEYPKIIDNQCISPISGILSAFEIDAKTAWLVVACDMPSVDESVIQKLIQNRNSSKPATTFFNPVNQAPEPLLTIYEPSIFEILKKYVSAGNKSPMRLLQSFDIQLISLDDDAILKNVNTSAEYLDFVK